MRWIDSVRRAIDRFCKRNGREHFTRQELIWRELPEIIRETGTRAVRPSKRVRSRLRELVSLGELEELAEGEYRRVRRPF